MSETPSSRSRARAWLAGRWYRLLASGPHLKPPQIFTRSLEEEVGDWRQYLVGNVLNAGAGATDISSFVEGRVWNQDIPDGLHNGKIDFLSPLDAIPVADSFFDAIFCNAVLEHVDNPAQVMAEFQRVCRPGGHLYLCIPFLQPEHRDPGDYQRYTVDGLRRLLEDHGFDVVAVEGLYSVHHTLAWIVSEWLEARLSLENLLLRWLCLPYLRWRCTTSTVHIGKLATAFRAVGRRQP